MKQATRPQGRRPSAVEADLEAALERARGDSDEELAFFKQLMDAMVYVHAPVSDDARTLRLVQFRHPDGFDAIPFFTSLGKAEVASSAIVKILGVSGRDLLEGSRGATLMLNPNDGGIVLYPEEIATWLDTGFLARVAKPVPFEFKVGPAQSAPAWLAPTIAQSLQHASFVSAAYLLETHQASTSSQRPGLLIWLVVDMAYSERAARLVTTAIQPLCSEVDVVIDLMVHDASQPLPEALDDPQVLPIFTRTEST